MENEGIYFRALSIDESDRISEIDPSQWIEKVWRMVEGEYKLVTINYMEEDWPDGFETYQDKLQETITTKGLALGTFTRKEELIGFVTLDRDFFGVTAKYVLLDSMFISRPYRGKGIGKLLFRQCVEKASKWGADKLYMCAASSEDTTYTFIKV